MKTLQQIEKLHSEIEQLIFYRNQPSNAYELATDKLIELCGLINSYDDGETENIWYIGESGNCTVDSLLAGAYWHYVEWHGGQDSVSYRALCAIGSIFNPGCSDGVENETSEEDVYIMLNDMAEKCTTY